MHSPGGRQICGDNRHHLEYAVAGVLCLAKDGCAPACVFVFEFVCSFFLKANTSGFNNGAVRRDVNAIHYTILAKKY